MSEEYERFMRLAIDEAARGGAEGNLAVGSVITRDNTVVGRGRNLVGATHDPTAHAETVALREAGPALALDDLAGCTLYTTFEPCPMCCGALMVSGVSTLVMGGRPEPSERRWADYAVARLIAMAGWDSNLRVVTGVLVPECLEVRRTWAERNAT
jgi:tRNA(adenine34) deaminase